MEGACVHFPSVAGSNSIRTVAKVVERRVVAAALGRVRGRAHADVPLEKEGGEEEEGGRGRGREEGCRAR